MKKISSILFFFVLFLICTDVMAMEFIKTGPFGTPILVKDPYGNFSIPIKVYSDPEIEVFIPNITAPGWVFWNKDVFNQKGTYFTYIYDHFKNESYCLRQILPKGKHSDADRLAACSQLRYRCRLILVDVRQNNVTMREVILMGKDAIWHPANVSNPNLTYPLKGNSQLSKATLLSIAKITAIVEKEVREAGSTQSAQDVMRHNREMTSRMAAAGRPSSGKSITDINCEKDCYADSKAYTGLRIYNAEDCKQKCPYYEKKKDSRDAIKNDGEQVTQDLTAREWFFKAEALMEAKKCNAAKKVIEYVDNAIKLQPDYADAYVSRGNAYSCLGQYQRTIEDCDKAISLKTTLRALAHNNRGGAYLELGQKNRAIEDFNEAIRLNPKYAEAYFNRGNAYYDLNQYQLAIEECSRSIDLKPDFAPAYGTRGSAYLMLGSKEFGCRDLRKDCDLGNCELLEMAIKKKLCELEK